MKILIVTGIFPPDHGGPASHVPAIASALAHKHQIVALVTLSDDEHPDGAFPFPLVRIPRHQPRSIRLLTTIATIRRLTRQADVVYLNGLLLEGISACKVFARRPVVMKVVGDLIWERARNQRVTSDSFESFQARRYSLKWEILKHLQCRCIRAADRVIVPSRYLARIVRGWGVPVERIAIVYNGVQTPAACETEPRFDLVTVARLVDWKGVGELILLAAVNGWSLKIVGDGPLRRPLEAMARDSGAAARIHFVGRVPAGDVVQHIRSARLFVLNSSYEGLPHVVLEAKAAGVAVVASAAGGTPETISDGVDGMLFGVNDGAALKQVVRRLLDDGVTRRRIAEAGMRQVHRGFPFLDMAAATESLLAGAASGRTPGRTVLKD